MNRWSQVADVYERSFAGLCDGIAPAVRQALGDPDQRSTLLDVGCGTGRLSARLAEWGWQVSAVDAAEDMVSAARDRLGASARVDLGQLPDLDFADRSFDVVLANFVVNHLAKPAVGVAELVRVADSAVLATSWTTEPPANVTLIGEVFAQAGVDVLPGLRLPEADDFPRTVEGLAGLFSAAGAQCQFADLIRWEWVVSPDDLWAGVTGGVGVAGATYLAQDSATRAHLDALVAKVSEPYRDPSDGLLRLPSCAALVMATR